jgi:hypothetical protein
VSEQPEFKVQTAERCDACGFVYDERAAPEAAGTIRRLAETIASTLEARPEPAVRTRPDPTTWSALEYGCHVRDVLLVQRERVLWARREDCPAPAPMGRDERVDHDGYAVQDLAAVTRQLVDAAELFANVLDRLDSGAWNRTLVYNYPTRVERPLRWVAVHTVHELTHHRADIDGLAD